MTNLKRQSSSCGRSKRSSAGRILWKRNLGKDSSRSRRSLRSWRRCAPRIRKYKKNRKQRLGGLFALTEDDIEAEGDDEANRARIAREKARVEKKQQAAERPEPVRAGYSFKLEGSSRSSDSSASLQLMDPNAASNLTAADLDGNMHGEHKFSKVWKDWDAAKKSDPGEVARQFMKIAAIKRRGYAPSGDRPSSRSRSRSGGRGGGRQQQRRR